MQLKGHYMQAQDSPNVSAPGHLRGLESSKESYPQPHPNPVVRIIRLTIADNTFLLTSRHLSTVSTVWFSLACTDPNFALTHQTNRRGIG